MRSSLSILVLTALLATAVFAVPEDIAANRPMANGAGVPDSLQDRIKTRYAQAKQLADQLQANLDQANANMDKLTMDLNQNDEDVDAHWLLFGIPVVIGVVIGYSFLEAGSVRSVNVVQILMKNVLIATISAFVWWAVGYGFAFGDNRNNHTANGFIGNGKIFLISDKVAIDPSEYGFWTYTWAYATMAGIIATQTLGERTRTPAYFIMTVLFVGFLYPVVCHWCWSTTGWVSPHVVNRATFARSGVIDRAGSGVVHMTAGFAAFAGTLLLRGRQGRFDEDYQRQFPQKFRGSNRVYQGIGVFFIWVSWYGATVVSPEAKIRNMYSIAAAKTTINTTLAAAFAILVTIAVDCLFEGKKALREGEEPSWHINLFRMLNGAIAGLVAISAGCHVVEPWGAMFIGAIGAIIYVIGARLLFWLNIDDPLEVVSSHAFAGVAGLTSVGWFARLEDVTFYYNWTLDERDGIWYGGNAGLWGVQWITALTIIAWSFFVTAFLYWVLRFFGLLRVSFHVEAEGIDATEPVYAPVEQDKKREPKA